MKILNFGSLNIDYVYSVDHFVNKGETLSSDGLHVYSGGKGLNQSIAMSRAGAEVYHAGAVGEDGRFLLELLESAGVNTEYIQVLSDVRTGNAIIQNDVQGDNCILLYSGANRAVTRKMADEVLKHFDQGDWLVLQNEISEIPYIVRRAHEKGMKIILNPSPMDEKIFQIPLDEIDCLILNEVEALGLISNADCDNQEPDGNAIMKKLKEKFPDMEILLTLGEKGSVYCGRAGSGCDESGIGMTGGKSSSGMPDGENVLHQEAYKVQAVDTTAAGDTFTGYFLAQRMNGADVKQALAMASAASALAVSRKGVAPSIPEREEAERSLRIFQQESCEAELNAENSGGGQKKAAALQKDFCIGFLLPYFTEIHMPLGSFGNAKGQENQVPDQFEIFHGSGGKDDSLDDLYLENYSNTEFVSEEDVHEFLSHVSELLETFHDGVGFEFRLEREVKALPAEIC